MSSTKILHLHRFQEDTTGIELPESFTYPFFYQPHRLTELATAQLQTYLEEETIPHNFGLGAHADLLEQGKMFGVLVVRDGNGELGFLAGYSGKMEEANGDAWFVPPICDIHAHDSFYKEGERKLNAMTAALEQLKNNPERNARIAEIQREIDAIEAELTAGRKQLKMAKKERQKRRETVKLTMSPQEFEAFAEQLAQESIAGQVAFKHHAARRKEVLEKLIEERDTVNAEVIHAEKTRRAKSNRLQKEIFDQYVFLNALGEEAPLSTLFPDFELRTPPSGSGDCAAPKMLQYAYQHGLHPICMGEFWWGSAPASEVRQHKNFYPSCGSRCRPILGHMLNGLTVDENPLLELGTPTEMKVVYQDEDLMIVDKPSGLLSVPGVDIEDSAFTRVQLLFPDATGAILVHRLDMSTSGILLFTRNPKANKRMQKQFIKRTVKKRYVAVVEGVVEEDSGVIELPLAPDYYDLPRQRVCHERGKPAKTLWEVVNRENGRTRLHLYPVSGRTHQLRVHCAHPDGLGMPIVGDELYGKMQDRLHLHAEWISFEHPGSKEPFTLEVPASF